MPLELGAVNSISSVSLQTQRSSRGAAIGSKYEVVLRIIPALDSEVIVALVPLKPSLMLLTDLSGSEQTILEHISALLAA